MRRRRLVVLLLGLTVAACGSDSDRGDDGGGFVSSLDCDGLADRWIDIQQEYLDKLGDAGPSELEDGTDRVIAAGRWVGQAMLEQVRDSRSAGCADELVAGSPKLCTRLDRLAPKGGAAERIVESFRDACLSEG